jgi:GTPase SAR1 family protein
MIASTGEDGRVCLWHADTRTAFRVLQWGSATIHGVAWSPVGSPRLLAAASAAYTICVWDADSGRKTNVLEGHTAGVNCVAFSADGRLLASKGSQGDDTVRLWRCDTWQPVASISEPAWDGAMPGLAFHPQDPVLAAVGSDPDCPENKRDTLVHVWHLDVARLLAEPPTTTTTLPPQVPQEPAVQYTTAKIVLVGDSGVGKTGLGWRLAHGEFKEHVSTHGQQFWVLGQLGGHRGDGARCEAVLWDLAGQPDYRLIHALFIEDADLALVAFDPTDSRDPLGGVEYWLQQLPPQCPKILVAARSDRGSPTLTRAALEDYCRQRGISGGFVETSALRGVGIDDLLGRMREQIDWDAKTATTTTATFKRVKDFVLGLKENRWGERIVVTPEELRQRLQAADEPPFTEAEMMTAAERLASHGYVRVLKTSEGRQRILLVPELLNNLAASFVLEARRNPKGLGALAEQRILDGGYPFSELDGLSGLDRNLLLDATIVAFLENRLSYRCFREVLGETRLLVFPELMNLRKPQAVDETIEEGVSYTVTGAGENTYAALVVLLGYTNAFQRTDQWHNQARYEFQDGLVCGFQRADGPNGGIDFVLFYGPDVGPSVRALFQGLFESFLARQNVTVRRFAPVSCASCGEPLDRSVVRDRLGTGKSFAFCNECGNRLELPPADEPIRLTRVLRGTVERQRGFAEQRVVFEQAVFRLNTFVEGQGIRRPTCFISYAWGDRVEAWKDSSVERWVAQFDEDLRKAGLTVLFDRRSNAKFGSSIPRFIDQISRCDRILVVGTPLYLKKYENRMSETGSVVAAEMDLVSDRMLGTEADKESVVPLLLSGNERSSLPPSLRRRVYADFRDEGAYFSTAFDLMVSLYGIDFSHPAVTSWRRSLHGDEAYGTGQVADETEGDGEQLRRALPEVGRVAREEAFKAGQPVVVLKDGRPVWVYPDGTEHAAGPGPADITGSPNR